MTKELFKDISRYLPSFLIPSLIGFIAIPILTRLFPPIDYGNYTLVLATVSLLSMIATGWLGSSILRFYPIYSAKNQIGDFNITLIKITLITTCLAGLIFLGSLYFAKSTISNQLLLLMRIGILVFIAISWYNVLGYFLRANRQVGWFSIFSIYNSILGLGFGLFLVILFHKGVDGLLWGLLLSHVTVLPVLTKMSIRTLKRGKYLTNPSIASNIVKYGFPLVMVNATSWMLTWADRYILEIMRGSYEVGIYSASYALADKTIYVIVSIFILASGPIAFNIWETQKLENSQKFVQNLTRYYLIITVPILLDLCILAKPMLALITGPEYHQGYKIIPLIAISTFLIGLQRKYMLGLSFHKKTSWILFYNICGTTLNIILNILYIPKFGYMAAAITTLIATVFEFFLSIIISLKYFTWKFPFYSLFKIVCAAGLMGLFISFTQKFINTLNILNLLIILALGILIYILILFFSHEFRSEEISLVRNFIVDFLKKNKS